MQNRPELNLFGVLPESSGTMTQNPKAEKSFKIGATGNPSWIAYWISGLIFVKEFEKKEGEYPDFGCDVEVYTDWTHIEVETLGPLKTLNPSESIKHTEVWRIATHC